MRLPQIYLFVLCYFLQITHGLKLSSDDAKYARYLIKFGYMGRNSMRTLHGNTYVEEDEFSDALKNFQSYARLSQTGELDDATRNMMHRDRCQAKDVELGSRKKRYTVNGNWPKKHLTYKISKYSANLSKTEVDSIIFLAFSVWSAQADITVTERKQGRTDMDIKFESISPRANQHIYGNTNSRDRTIVITLNDDVLWSQNFSTGLPNLFQTAAHEIGHALGLGHTNIQDAMMYAVYDFGRKTFTLHEDDIQGIKSVFNDVKAISYPGKSKYRKFATNLQTSYEDLKDKLTASFGPLDFKELKLPSDFFENGF